MWINRLLITLGGLLGALGGGALTLFPMRPEEVESQAAAWLSYVGFSEWTEELTKTTDQWVIGGLGALLLVAFVLLGVGLIRIFRGAGQDDARGNQSFDVPMSKAVEHCVRTIPDSFLDPDLHAFQAIHRAMCEGTLAVIGSRGEGVPPKRIGARKCRRLKPMKTLVPRSLAAPKGVRFDLYDKPLNWESGAEYRDPIGFTNIRIRSRDLYRLWPKDQDDG